MSLLNQPVQPPMTDAQKSQIRKNQVNMKAQALVNAPLQNFNGLLTQWQKGMDLIWDDENPNDILLLIGVHAVELFTLSGQTAAFLESLKKGCTEDRISKIKAYTAHPDGSITVT